MVGHHHILLLILLLLFCVRATTALSCPFGNATSASCKDWEKEVRTSQLEAKIDSLVQEVAVLKESDVERKAELKVTREMLKKCLSRKEATWQLKRIDLILPKLQKLQLGGATPTIVDSVPLSFPTSTKAIIVSVYCHFWNGAGHAYLGGEIRQAGNNEDGAAKFDSQHFNVYANTWYHEMFVPWNSSFNNELEVKVTMSYMTGGAENWFTIKIVGYVSI